MDDGLMEDLQEPKKIPKIYHRLDRVISFAFF